MPSVVRLLLVALVGSLLGAVGAAPHALAATPADSLLRLAGADRVATSVAVAEHAWAVADTVVLARKDDPADALAGTPLAASLDAPLVVTSRSHLEPAVERLLASLRTERVVLLGGEAALGRAVSERLEALGYATERVAGPDRFATAARIADRMPKPQRAFVVGGWRDALAVSGVAASTGAPILLARGGSTGQAEAAIERLAIREVFVADLDGVVPAEFFGGDARRLVAEDAPELSRTVVDLADSGVSGPLVVATDRTFPDGLAAGALAARSGGTLVLVGDEVSDAAAAWLEDNAHGVTGVLVAGGPVAVRPEVVAGLRGHLVAHGAPLARQQPARPTRQEVDVVIEPSDDAGAVVASHPAGSHFLLASGVHRLAEITARPGDRFSGEAGTVLSGAKVLEGWQRDSRGRWYVDGQDQEADRVGEWGSGGWQSRQYAIEGHEQEVHVGEELFVDGRRLRHVNRLPDVDAPGEWFFDQAADRITMFDDPRSSLIETSVVDFAIRGHRAHGVTVEHLEVRHYATRAQRGPISAETSWDWRIRHVVVHHNHGSGVHAGPGTHLSHCRAFENGQLGISAHGEDEYDAQPIVIERCEVSSNGQLGFDPTWEAGGLKVKHAPGVRILDNHVLDQPTGKGIWLDGHNSDVVVARNLVERNGSSGIFYEIGHGGRIHDNLVRHNSVAPAGGLTAGIFVVDSHDVEVSHNVVYDNAWQLLASHQERSDNHELGPTGVRGWTVHDNLVAGHRAVGLHNGASAGTEPWTQGNTFFDNTYFGGEDSAFLWDGPRSAPWWRDAGHTRGERFVAAAVPPSPAWVLG